MVYHLSQTPSIIKSIAPLGIVPITYDMKNVLIIYMYSYRIRINRNVGHPCIY